MSTPAVGDHKILIGEHHLVAGPPSRLEQDPLPSCLHRSGVFCGTYIPAPTRVEACLRQRRSELSDGCRMVFEQGAAQQTPTTGWTAKDD